MQGREFLFQRSDLNPQTPKVLSDKYNFGRAGRSNTSINLLSQFNLSRIQPFNENTTDLFYTPPMEKKSAPTPKAPVKLKKQPKKSGLKPKKLQYTEDELNITSVIDSGVFTRDDTPCFKLCTPNHNSFDLSQKQRRTLRSTLNRDGVQTNDKENDKNIVGKKSTNKTNNQYDATQECSVAFNPNVEKISQCSNHQNWIDVLHWLQPRRDVGLWIECCRKTCKKWRHVQEYHDPVDVPTIWYCEMNSEKSVASCTIPECPLSPAIKSDLIENAYNAGSIVWAYIRGYPCWPGIVDDCPDSFTYYRLSKNSIKPVSYYVIFFNGDKLEYAWVNKRNLKPLVKYKYSQIVKRTKYRGIDYAEPLKEAYEEARNALSLSILERLRRFSFIARYEKLCDINNNSSQPVDTITETAVLSETGVNSDDEIPCSDHVRRRFSLKEYYSYVISKRRDTQ